MPTLRTRAQQPNPVSPVVELPTQFPPIPKEIIDRFPDAESWQKRLNDFWTRTTQSLQEAQSQVARQSNSQVIFSTDRFLIYANGGIPQPMFALDSTGVKLGDVLVINTPGRKVYIGEGVYADDGTPFYIDTTGRFSLGANLTWDPETSTLTITGTINATSGTIGGFTIGTDYIRDVANSFGLASTVTGGDDVRFWAGDTFANRASAPFYVKESGALRAISGVVGGFTLSSTTLSAGTGTASITISSSGTIKFGVDGAGVDYSVISVGGFTVKKSTLILAYITTFHSAGIMAVADTSGVNSIELVGETGVINFTTDTNLYRSSANVLQTDDSFYVGGTLTVNANSGALPAGPTGTLFQVGAADGVICRATLDSFAAAPQLYFRRADTTNAAKSAVQTGEQFGAVAGAGYGASAYGSAVAYMAFTATENWSNTAQGCQLELAVTPNGSVTAAVGLTLITAGVTVVGTLSTSAPTGGAGAWLLGKYTAGVVAQAGKVKVKIDGTEYDLLTA